MLYYYKSCRVTLLKPQPLLRPSPSMLTRSAAQRLVMILALLALLWVAVTWAVAIP